MSIKNNNNTKFKLLKQIIKNPNSNIEKGNPNSIVKNTATVSVPLPQNIVKIITDTISNESNIQSINFILKYFTK